MYIDLNADLGESYGSFQVGNDLEMFKTITSANIACGFHAGDYTHLAKTVANAKSHNVAIGAHPGYPDIHGFGRRDFHFSKEEIYQMMIYQIGAVKAFCQIDDVHLHHVKPHGALYNKAVTDDDTASAIAKAIADLTPTSLVYTLPNSRLEYYANMLGLKVAREGFADRAYQKDGTLVPRSISGSVLTEMEDISEQILGMIFDKRVKSLTGEWVDIDVQTICFHGDGQSADRYLTEVKRMLEARGVKVQPVYTFL
ncbi:LamB/YcsF family protein [Chryseomicrobium palamuruense]|uniref:LamB/YcsF family protein n=1 Tax=Chryseomicrobium palamuruense TaxID=682973 RepID=A0ABV8UT51_9BACL